MADKNLSITNKILTFDEIKSTFESLKKEGKIITLCHGVFDLLHPGHLRHLASAKNHAEILLVSITSDKYVNKGPGRPAFPEGLRAEALANLQIVDYVVITPYPTALEIIQQVKPNVYAKGNDYLAENKDPTGNISKERDAVEQFGGKMINTDEIVFSSSQLINEFLSPQSNTVQLWLKEFKNRYDADEVLDYLDKISRLKVAVVGETIIDVYTYCEALGKSSKDPVLCLNKEKSLSYVGGILAIGSNCNGLGAETTVITGLNQTSIGDTKIKGLINKGIDIKFVDISPFPTIKKERFVDSRTSTRVLEIYEMNDSPLSKEKNSQFVEILCNTLGNIDVVIVADYGHGLISDEAIDTIVDSSKFLALNVQMNAGNRGFNSVARYPRADFLTLNGMEAQLETRRRHVDINSFIEKLALEKKTKQILVTKGSDGIDIYGNERNFNFAPALAPHVKDRVGAGDAVLSVTSLLAAVNAPEEIIGFIGNIVGAWAVTFIGNEKNLDRGVLSRQIKSILS